MLHAYENQQIEWGGSRISKHLLAGLMHFKKQLWVLFGQKKRLELIPTFFLSLKDYFTSKLALLAICLASAEDLSTEVSSPYPL